MAQLKGTLSARGRLVGSIAKSSGGTWNYPDLENLPQINGVTLIDNKTSEELGINIPTKTSDLENNSGFITSDALPTKTSDLRNDSGYVTMLDVIWGIIDDAQSDNDSTYSSNKIEAIIDALLPIDKASGAIATFSTALAKTLVSIDVDESATKVYQRGTNLWNEKWETGDYDGSGNKRVYNTRLRCKDQIPVAPSTSYRFYMGTTSGIAWQFYDEDHTFISQQARASGSGGFELTTPSNCHYLTFGTWDGYGGTYLNDICIRTDGKNGYVAYNPASDEYSISEIDNIVTFAGDNNIFADSGNIDIAFKDSIQHYIDKKIAETQALIL